MNKSYIVKQITKKLIFFPFILYANIIFANITFVPFFDGGFFFTTLISAVQNKFNLLNFTTNLNYSHPSIIYFLYSSLSQYINLGNSSLLHLSNLILGLLAIFAFYKILRFIFFNTENHLEIALITAVFAVYPVFTASTLNFNLDFGLTCFFLLFLYSLLYQKNPILILLFAISMIFSKEPGLILFTISIIFYLIFFITRMKEYPLKEKIKRLFKYLFIFFISINSFLIYCFFKKHSGQNQIVAFINVESGLKDALGWLFTFNLFDKSFLQYFTAVFALNFNWIFSFFILIFSLIKTYSLIFNAKIKSLNSFHDINKKAVLFITGVFITATYVFVSYKHFLNPRYFLPLYALLIILFYYIVVSLIANNKLRKTILIALFVLIFLSNFRTIDPISKLVFGTFKFGKHDMLYITSISKEPPAYGRDQIVYNLEFANIHYLLNGIFQDIKPTDETIFLNYQWTDWVLYSPLAKNTFKRTFSKKDAIQPKYLFNVNWQDQYEEIYRFIKQLNKPQIVYFIEMPIFRDDEQDLSNLLNFLKNKNISFSLENDIYSLNGYEMKVYKIKFI